MTYNLKAAIERNNVTMNNMARERFQNMSPGQFVNYLGENCREESCINQMYRYLTNFATPEFIGAVAAEVDRRGNIKMPANIESKLRPDEVPFPDSR